MEIKDNPNAAKSIAQLVSELAQVHCELWDQEDRARSKDDKEVVAAKRKIDALNQRRNDMIEKIDESVVQTFQKNG